MDVPTNEGYDYLFKLLCVGVINVEKSTSLHRHILLQLGDTAGRIEEYIEFLDTMS
jgi:hypothetical protein